MSSLYYQHRQHEQQVQQQHQQQQQQRDLLRREREQQHYQCNHQHHYQDRYPQSQTTPEPEPSPSHRNPDRNRNRNGSLSPSHPSRESTLETLLAMMTQERSGYNLDTYFPPEVLPNQRSLLRRQNVIHGGWREKICQWSYNVVDHFDLPREIVSISMNFFDRYMATLSTAETVQGTKSKPETTDEKGRSSPSPQGSGDLALLASLGTLHLATKVHATNHNDYDPSMGPLEEQHHKVPSLTTLANLSRGQFGPSSILEMEKLLLGALKWRLHPPTLYAFVTFLLKLLPTTNEDPSFGLKPSIASELFEVAMYVAELSVCDAFFVERQIPSSTIALAAICTAMDNLLAPEDDSMADLVLGTDSSFLTGTGCFTEKHRSLFSAICSEQLDLGNSRYCFEESVGRLRSMYLGASALDTPEPQIGDEAAPTESQSQAPQRARTNSYNPPTSPSSIADMSLSTINSTIHSMADTTINCGGGGSIKRGDSMVSSIACQSSVGQGKETDDDELFGGPVGSDDLNSQTNSNTSHTNFRYSPSPPREGEADLHEPHISSYGDNHLSSLRRTMSCSPIVAQLR